MTMARWCLRGGVQTIATRELDLALRVRVGEVELWRDGESSEYEEL